ncbi:hypothetical protein CYMTET_5310 [Cymbomonas tetramitiformis]|uniref:Uncharacterized protein n=1 Tax=Cymbomonas tetramitiformis TaxID=36881 RepID=A0AAE0LJ71_9CHLO|nr:hypothetical protein CYMTET_5310 [Cymbomonas tetramitiformis]
MDDFNSQPASGAFSTDVAFTEMNIPRARRNKPVPNASRRAGGDLLAKARASKAASVAKRRSDSGRQEGQEFQTSIRRRRTVCSSAQDAFHSEYSEDVYPTRPNKRLRSSSENNHLDPTGLDLLLKAVESSPLKKGILVSAPALTPNRVAASPGGVGTPDAGTRMPVKGMPRPTNLFGTPPRATRRPYHTSPLRPPPRDLGPLLSPAQNAVPVTMPPETLMTPPPYPVDSGKTQSNASAESTKSQRTSRRRTEAPRLASAVAGRRNSSSSSGTRGSHRDSLDSNFATPAIHDEKPALGQTPSSAAAHFQSASNAPTPRNSTPASVSTPTTPSTDLLQNDKTAQLAANVAELAPEVAVTAACKWLDCLLLDAKGRVAAVRRSRRRVQRSRAEWQEQLSQSAAAGDESMSEAVPERLREMDLALAAEASKVERWLKQIEEMRAMCGGPPPPKRTRTSTGTGQGKPSVGPLTDGGQEDDKCEDGEEFDCTASDGALASAASVARWAAAAAIISTAGAAAMKSSDRGLPPLRVPPDLAIPSLTT